MALDDVDDIISMHPDRVCDFICQCRQDKTLSSLVRGLNDLLMHGDAPTRARASAALSRMGFLEVA